MLNFTRAINLFNLPNSQHIPFYCIPVDKNNFYLWELQNSDSQGLFYTSGSLRKRTDKILHKTLQQLLFLSFSAFHLSRIDECRGPILTRSWLYKFSAYKVE